MGSVGTQLSKTFSGIAGNLSGASS
jgi:hypothetical protein